MTAAVNDSKYLEAELDAANKKIQAAIVAIKNGYGGDTYNSKTIEILKGE